MSDNVTATESTENSEDADTTQDDAAQTQSTSTEEPDWKALARQWEKRAKANSKASEELEALRKQSMSEQEKAVAEAKAAGAAEAAKSHGTELAAAKLEAAAAAKGLDLSSLDGLLNVAAFVGDDGKVDTAAITKAVEKLAKSFPAGPKRGSGDFDGGNGAGQITEAQLAQMSPEQIAAALEKGQLKHLM
jgi:hypothetical protein